MSTLFGILFALSCILFLVALVKPDAFKNTKSGETPAKKSFLKGFSVMIFIFFILTLAFSPDSSQQPDSKQTAATEKIDTSPVQKEHVVTDISTLKKLFNEFSDEAESKLRITSITVQKGEVNDVAQYMFNKLIGITCTISKIDKSVTDMILIAQGDGSMRSGMNIMLAMGGLINATNPTLKPEQRGEILREIGFIGENVDIKKLNGEAVRNNIKYAATFNEQIGIMFTVSHIENN